ncbi:hypothetical protein ANN_23655 [Periplaneta americana]|uniref:Per a allergen n=1 Tax=Periplaneta americana TaxID=6978 RepID=A0ABQ8SMW2_PERAM|nr:hypothetical protein ANN_23655 [Periplaneta americana]
MFMWIRRSIYQGFMCGVYYHLGTLDLFYGTVTGEVYLEMLRTSILPDVRALYGADDVFYQQDHNTT